MKTEEINVTAELGNGEQIEFLTEGFEMEETAMVEIKEENVEKEVAMVERKQAVLAGLAGAIGSGVIGFIGGKALEKRKRKQLLKVVEEGIEMLVETVRTSEEKLEAGQEFDNIELVEALKAEIGEVLFNAKVSDKEKAQWSNLMMQLTNVVAATAHMEVEIKTLKAE